MKQIIVLMMSIFMITLCLVGCGNSGHNISGVNPQESVTSTPQAEAKTPNSTVGALISEEEAKKLALEKVPGASEKDVRIHLDHDDGKTIYEGSIVYEGVEYDFEIDADSGVILEWEKEIATG